MINQEMVKWLVARILQGKINSNTGNPFQLEDIKIQEYKDAVQAVLEQSNNLG